MGATRIALRAGRYAAARAARNKMRVESAKVGMSDASRRLGYELQTHDADQDEREAEEAKRIPRFPEEDDAEDHRAHGADPRPDRVARPYGKRLQRLRQKEQAHRHRRSGP